MAQPEKRNWMVDQSPKRTPSKRRPPVTASAFDPMIERAERFAVTTVSVPIVRKADLITMKQRAASDPAQRRSNALRDQADGELLTGDVPDPNEGW